MLEDITGQGIKEQLKTNRKLRIILFSVGAVVLLVLSYFVYMQFVWNPANEKSKNSYWEALNYAKVDSTEASIPELRAAIKKYDGKIGGEVAQFVYARQLMTKGEFKKALKELDEVDIEDTYVSVLRIGLKGDCTSELGKYGEASKMYEEAANMLDNDYTTPMYLNKSAICAEELKDFKKATEYYKRIMDDYPAYATQYQIEKFHARASQTKVK